MYIYTYGSTSAFLFSFFILLLLTSIPLDSDFFVEWFSLLILGDLSSCSALCLFPFFFHCINSIDSIVEKIFVGF